MVEYNGIKVRAVDGSGILISTPVNEFIFNIKELEWIYQTEVVNKLVLKQLK